jgi:hypothetical protein
MKKIILSIILACNIAGLFAQAPQLMSYQTVIRDINDRLVTSQSVGMQISILQGTSSGTVVYKETQTTNTNINGLASLSIGNGNVVSGTFAGINWAAGPYYIKTETDITGGTNYKIIGTAQLESVPYALYSGGSAANLNGTQDYVMKFTPNGTTGGNSLIYDNGTNVLIGSTSPTYSNDMFEVQSGIGNAVSGFSTSSTYSGIYGKAEQGWGVVGIGSVSISGYGGLLGESFSSSGTGVVGSGNALGSGGSYSLTAGSGGAFTGTLYGVEGSFLSSSTSGTTECAGGYFADQPDQAYYSYVAYYDPNSQTNYKIIGTGTVSTIAKGPNGDKITLHCPEAPEIYFEDYGEAKLTNGKAHINIDPLFADNVIVNEKHPLRVYVQLEGESNGVYITNKTSRSFDVVELQNGASNISFQYHVICNRADELSADSKHITSRNADLRFEKAPEPLKSKVNPPANTPTPTK